MDYPIYDGPERIGTLIIRRAGLYVLFTADLPLREGLHRLWLCGERESVCLGVLEPQGDRLQFERRLSRAACASLPAPICASLTPQHPIPAPQPGRKTGAACERELFGQRFIIYRSCSTPGKGVK